ncbi:MAG: hypothetical protein WD270_08490 [Acetobacterales bacterium]
MDRIDLEPFRRIATGNASDAMEAMGMRRTVILGLTMIAQPGTKLVGRAFTMRQLPKYATANKDDPLTRHQEVVGELAQPGDVVMIDCCGNYESSSLGEMNAFMAASRGVAGVVVDGAIRDATSMRECGMPVFSAATTAVKSRWDFETVGIGEPVAIRGVQVRAGDIVLGDESAVVVIPASHALEVLKEAIAIGEKEDKVVASLRRD